MRSGRCSAQCTPTGPPSQAPPNDSERDGLRWVTVGDLSGNCDARSEQFSTRAHLDAFAGGESIVGANVVLWYVGHFTHETGHDHHAAGGGHIVGPTLKPDRW